MSKIAIVNQKGGVAKTTTALNLGAELAYCGKKVLLVDLDAQYSATSAIFGSKEIDMSLYNVITENISIKKVIKKSTEFGFDILPSNIMLSAVDLFIAQQFGRERIIESQLKKLDYDIILMDCPPALGLITVNALVSAKNILIPICPEYFSLRGLRLIERVIDDIEENISSTRHILAAVITRYRDRVITREAEQAIRKYLKGRVLETVIPENIKLEEAHNAHVPVYKYEKQCKGSKAYKQLCSEIIKKWKLLILMSALLKETVCCWF